MIWGFSPWGALQCPVWNTQTIAILKNQTRGSKVPAGAKARSIFAFNGTTKVVPCYPQWLKPAHSKIPPQSPNARALASSQQLLASSPPSHFPRKLKPVLQQRQVRNVPVWPDRFDLGDNRRQFMAPDCFIVCGYKFPDRTHGHGPRNPRSHGYFFQIAACRRCCRESSDGKQAFIIEHHIHQVFLTIARHGCL